MTDFSQYKDYEANEKDLDSILNYLRIFDPSNATQEMAIDFHEYLRTGAHKIAHNASDEELKKLYEKFSSEKPQNNSHD